MEISPSTSELSIPANTDSIHTYTEHGRLFAENTAILEMGLDHMFLTTDLALPPDVDLDDVAQLLDFSKKVLELNPSATSIVAITPPEQEDLWTDSDFKILKPTKDGPRIAYFNKNMLVTPEEPIQV